MTDKDFYDRIDKARSLFTSREAVTRYCHDIRMLEDICCLLADSCMLNFECRACAFREKYQQGIFLQTKH